MQILNTLAPVFLLIAVGAALQARALVSPGFLREANRLTYWLALPALLFTQLTASLHLGAGAGRLLTGMMVATLLALVLAYVVAAILRVPGSALGTFVQGGFRGNLAFVGLPVIFLLPEVTLAGGVSSRSAAVLVVAPAMVAYNLLGVVVLLLSQHRLGWAMLRPFLKQLLTTPPLVATLAGIAFVFLDWRLPLFLDQTFAALGAMALPLGLLGVGGSLVTTEYARGWSRPLASALVKTAGAPLLGWAVAAALGLGAIEREILLILLACPTAIVSYTMAVELKGDGTLAASTIGLSVVLSLPALVLILALS